MKNELKNLRIYKMGANNQEDPNLPILAGDHDLPIIRHNRLLRMKLAIVDGSLDTLKMAHLDPESPEGEAIRNLEKVAVELLYHTLTQSSYPLNAEFDKEKAQYLPDPKIAELLIARNGKI